MNKQEVTQQEKNTKQIATWITPKINLQFEEIANQQRRNKSNLLKKIILEFLERNSEVKENDERNTKPE